MQEKQTFNLTAHNYDLVFKESLSIFRNKTLDFLGLDLPIIVDFVKTEFCQIETHAMMCDLVFRLADGSILHLEEETAISRKDTIRFAMYDLQLLQEYNVNITTLVLTLNTPKSENTTLNTQNLQYKLLVKDMSATNGDDKIQQLQAKIANHEPINELEIIFLPLMYTEHSRIELVKKSVELVQTIAIEQQEQEKLVASILVLANRFLSKEQMEQIWEVIRMYKFMEFAEEKGMQQGLQEGRQQGLQEGLQQGLQQGKIESLTLLLLKKFNKIPNEYLCKIKSLTEAELDNIMSNIFELQQPDDLKKYLH